MPILDDDDMAPVGLTLQLAEPMNTAPLVPRSARSGYSG